MLNKINDFASGKKTYVVALVSIVYAVSGLLGGFLDQSTATMVILSALGLSGVRNAIK